MADLKPGDPVPATPGMIWSLTTRQREMLWAIYERGSLPMTDIDYPSFRGEGKVTGRDKLTLRTLVKKGLVEVENWHVKVTENGKLRAQGLR